MDTPPTAIMDVCVLYSAPVRDLIVRLAQAGMIQAGSGDTRPDRGTPYRSQDRGTPPIGGHHTDLRAARSHLGADAKLVDQFGTAIARSAGHGPRRNCIRIASEVSSSRPPHGRARHATLGRRRSPRPRLRGRLRRRQGDRALSHHHSIRPRRTPPSPGRTAHRAHPQARSRTAAPRRSRPQTPRRPPHAPRTRHPWGPRSTPALDLQEQSPPGRSIGGPRP